MLTTPQTSGSTNIYLIKEDHNPEKIVDVEKINALFGNISDHVVSQIESTLSPLEPTKGNIFYQTRPRVERWDLTSSQGKER